MSQADAYRAALERAAYGDAGREYGAGLDKVSRFLAGQGPMADSGGAVALRRNLYSDIYGKARSRIGQGYASYLGETLAARRRHLYQLQLQRLAAKQNKVSGAERIAGAFGGVSGAYGGGYA